MHVKTVQLIEQHYLYTLAIFLKYFTGEKIETLGKKKLVVLYMLQITQQMSSGPRPSWGALIGVWE